MFIYYVLLLCSGIYHMFTCMVKHCQVQCNVYAMNIILHRCSNMIHSEHTYTHTQVCMNCCCTSPGNLKCTSKRQSSPSVCTYNTIIVAIMTSRCGNIVAWPDVILIRDWFWCRCVYVHMHWSLRNTKT